MKKADFNQHTWKDLLNHWVRTGESPLEGGLNWRVFLYTLEQECTKHGDDTLWTAYSILKIAYENATGTKKDRQALPRLLGLHTDPRRTARDYYFACLAQMRRDQGYPASDATKGSDSAFAVAAADFHKSMNARFDKAIDDQRLTREQVAEVKRRLKTTVNERSVNRAYYETYEEKNPDWQLLTVPEHEEFIMMELWDLTTSPAGDQA